MNLVTLGILFFASFLPPLFYVLWIRNTEHFHRQPWSSILVCFFWGASIAVVAAFILEVVLDKSLQISIHDSSLLSFIIVIVGAPVIEEFVKPFALRLKTVKRDLSEVEDGLVYGAVAGLGFSATENLIYGWNVLSEGLIAVFVLIAIRSIGGCFLHASATAWTGYGYGKTLLKKSSLVLVLPYFLIAICMHGLYNFFASFDLLGGLSGLGLALLFALVSIRLIRKKIRKLDIQNQQQLSS
jgi:protease PrsW